MLINHKQLRIATPLYIASQTDGQEIVKLLLENGVNVNWARNSAATPLYIASQQYIEKLLNYY